MEDLNPFCRGERRESFNALLFRIVPTPDYMQAIKALTLAYQIQMHALAVIFMSDGLKQKLSEQAEQFLFDAVREMAIMEP